MKMSNEKFRVIVLPIVAIIVVLMIVLSMAANTYSAQLDMALGRGQRHVVAADNISEEATEYYDVMFPNPDAGKLQNEDPPTAIEEQSRNHAAETALKVAEEGVTLLKNDGVLPLAKNSKVTPFGYRYIEPVWGGSGSAATNMNFDYVETAEEALARNFTVNSTVVEKMKAATPIEMQGDLSAAPSTATWSNSGSTNMSIFEYDSSIYSGTESSCAGTVGIVFIGRLGLEGNDMWAFPYQNGVAQHSLQLTTHEKEMIQFAKTNCDKVVVICNFSNVVEMGELEKDSGIDAIVWIGNPGAKGLQAMSEVLVGDINPSGRTVDVWVADHYICPLRTRNSSSISGRNCRKCRSLRLRTKGLRLAEIDKHLRGLLYAAAFLVVGSFHIELNGLFYAARRFVYYDARNAEGVAVKGNFGEFLADFIVVVVQAVTEGNAAYDSKNDPVSGVANPDAILYKSEKPTSGADNGLTLSSLRGLAYDDPMWDELLDQIDFSDEEAISALITYGLYMTQPLDDIGLVQTGDNDGPLGLTATWSGTVGHVVACAWTSAPLTAATWNTDLVYEMGLAIGQEGLTNGIHGWYAPAVNLHRSPFGGRNFEYYSEDPLISGKIGAAMVSGARQNGLFAHIKHFALNEMDHACGNIQVYATEQSMREMYLRGFEIATKEAECTIQVYDGETGGQKTVELKAAGAYMTSMTFIGPKFSGASYELLTTLLRNEWGFEGFVITDFTSGDNKSKDCGYKVGNDLWMGMRTTPLNDLDTATAQWAARNAIKNIAYTIVNSSAYNGIAPGSYAYYDMSPWRIGLIVFDVIAGVIAAAGVAWVVLRTVDEKRHPEKYRKGGDDNE